MLEVMEVQEVIDSLQNYSLLVTLSADALEGQATYLSYLYDQTQFVEFQKHLKILEIIRDVNAFLIEKRSSCGDQFCLIDLSGGKL